MTMIKKTSEFTSTIANSMKYRTEVEFKLTDAMIEEIGYEFIKRLIVEYEKNHIAEPAKVDKIERHDGKLIVPIHGHDAEVGRKAELHVRYKDKEYTFRELSDLTGVPAKSLYYGFYTGRTMEHVIENYSPKRKNKRYEIDGKKLTQTEIIKLYNIPQKTVSFHCLRGDIAEYIAQRTNADVA